MINVLKMIKGKSTAGHRWPFQAFWWQVGHPLSPAKRDREERDQLVQPWPWGLRHWSQMNFQAVQFHQYPGFVLSLSFIIGGGEISPNRKGSLCTAFYSTCVCHTKYTTPLSVWMFFFSMHVVGN